MWKWFGALAVGLFVLAGGVAAYRYYQEQSREDLQRPFLEAMESGDPERLLALMDDSLRKKVDIPILEVWMQVVQARLGPVQELDIIAHTPSKSGDVTMIVSEAQVRFARGVGTSLLVFRDGELSDMALRSEELKSWLEDLPDTSKYEAEGRKFVHNFFGNKPKEAYLAMDPDTLQKTLPYPQLLQAMQALTAKGGKLHEVKLLSADFKPATEQQKVPVLQIDYEIVCDNAKSIAHLMYAFPGLKGRLIGFKFD